MRVSAMLILAFLLAAGTGWADEGAAQNDNPNVVAPSVLAPRLLHDEVKMAAYLAAFPLSAYRIFDVSEVGRFHLDSITDAVKDVLRAGKPWEPHVRKLIARYVRAGSTAVDVGAHVGTHTILLDQRVGSDGRVYAFEPQKKIYRELVRNLVLNKVANAVPLRFALGDEPRLVAMAPTVKGNEGHTAVGAGGDAVEMRTLDSFNLRNVSFIKIDVEGYEDPVLRGAAETIRYNHPVIVLEIQGGENHDDPTPQLRRKIRETIGILKSYGYTVRRTYEWDYLAIYEGVATDQQSIDVGTPEARPFLDSGFSGDEVSVEDTFAWGTGNESQIAFPLQPRTGDYSLTLRVHVPSFLGKENLKVRVNGVDAGALSLEAGWSTHEVAVPSGVFHTGENVIAFVSDRCGAPRDLVAGSDDPRVLSVAFDYVWVRPRPHDGG